MSRLQRSATRAALATVCFVMAGTSLVAQAPDTARAARRDSAPAAVDTGRRSAPATAPAAVDTTHVGAETAGPPTHDTTSRGDTAADSALQRVRFLVAQGQTTAARSLVDSLLTVTPAQSPAYPSILYTRATLATNADSAEDDYRRVIVEYAASPQVADALLRLAQLELARGDRQQAAAHLDRLVREQLPNQSGIGFARTELQVGLAYFDLQDTTRACTALTAAQSAAPTGDVELKNRIDYNTQRCPAPSQPQALASNGTRDTTQRASGRPDTAVRGGAGAASTRASGAGSAGGTSSHHPRSPGYTIQIAAYKTHTAAAALVERLRGRGYVARIFGTTSPYRVRVGRFATEVQADSAVRSLKRKGITGFVTPGEPAQ